ncbi:MAG: hypothetical protein FWG50_11790 [Kiritimatiellaeota bacterium]|nr:hypothetical protein [Kiritimatiellota bacterium]
MSNADTGRKPSGSISRKVLLGWVVFVAVVIVAICAIYFCFFRNTSNYYTYDYGLLYDYGVFDSKTNNIPERKE